MKLMYFAWLRQKIGTAQEVIDLPGDVSTIADLVGWLSTRGAGYAEAFKDHTAIKVAVDQEFSNFEASIGGASEVAFFPPVTGG